MGSIPPIKGYRRGSLFTPALLVGGVALVASAVSAFAIAWIARSPSLHYIARGAYFIGSITIGSLSFFTLILSILVVSRSRKIPIYNLNGAPSQPDEMQPIGVIEHPEPTPEAADQRKEIDRLFPEMGQLPSVAERFQTAIVIPAKNRAEAFLKALPLRDRKKGNAIEKMATEIQNALTTDLAQMLVEASKAEKETRNQILCRLASVVREITTLLPCALCKISANDLTEMSQHHDITLRWGAPSTIKSKLAEFFQKEPLNHYKLPKTQEALKSSCGILIEFLIVYAKEHLHDWFAKFNVWKAAPAANMDNMRVFFASLAQ